MYNLSLQNSSVSLDGSGKAVGWSISALNIGTTMCQINACHSDGVVRAGSYSPYSPPTFFIDPPDCDGGVNQEVGGAAFVICCSD